MSVLALDNYLSPFEPEGLELTVTGSRGTAAGINNLHPLFNKPNNLDRIGINKGRRADQLELRILLRYLAGLRGAGLTERYSPEVTFVVRLLLGLQP